MSININIDPVTRISGFLNIQTELENDTVINAKTGGQLFRGFEKMLRADRLSMLYILQKGSAVSAPLPMLWHPLLHCRTH